MTNQQFIEVFSALPREAQQQVADYIALLSKQYGTAAAAAKRPEVELANEPFIGMWRDRKEFEDSSSWVRETRRSEWSEGE